MIKIKTFSKGKNNIIHNFLLLLSKKHFNQISVADICKNANINRSTFYRNFVDKYELLDTIEDIIIKELTNIDIINNIPKGFNHIIYNTNFFEIIENNIDLVKILLGDNSPNTFFNKIQTKIKENILIFASNNNTKLKNYEIDIIAHYFSFVIAGTIKYWTNNPKIKKEELLPFVLELNTNGVFNKLILKENENEI